MENSDASSTGGRSLSRRIGLIALGLIGVYLLIAYVTLPELWKRDAQRHPALEKIPGITYTIDGIPGDPLNVALVGEQEEVESLMRAADWNAAAALGIRSDLKIAEDTIFARPDPNAPVSSLYLFGRKEDLAFEQPVGDNPRHRHHVRFWKCDKPDEQGRPVWVGSAVYDKGVGLSDTTGQITHHTAADVDAERDYLMGDLRQTGELSRSYSIAGFHKVTSGKNGGGDPWHTDGDLEVGVISLGK